MKAISGIQLVLAFLAINLGAQPFNDDFASAIRISGAGNGSEEEVRLTVDGVGTPQEVSGRLFAAVDER